MHYYVFVCGLTEGKKTKKLLYLEVSHHDESGSTDPACGQTCRVEDAVLVLLDDVGITEQHNHHHYSQGDTHRGGENGSVIAGSPSGLCWENSGERDGNLLAGAGKEQKTTELYSIYQAPC